MKFLASVVALSFATAVSAQAACASVASAIPACGTSCIESAGSAVGCASTDFACQCKTQNVAAINSAALLCVVSACGAVTGLEVSSSALAVCACAATAASAAPATTPTTSPATTSAAPVSSASSTPPASTASSAAGSSSSAAVTSATSTSSMAAATYPVSSATSAAGNGTTPFTGGQSLVQPMGVGAAVIALFAGVLAVL